MDARYRIVLLGFGNVGREFARLLTEHRNDLSRRFAIVAPVVGIVTAHHGSVENARGIDLMKAVRAVEAGGSLEGCGRSIRESSVEYLRRARADIAVEITPLRIASRQIALDHILVAFASGKHVITANKGPVVYHYHRLKGIARKARLGFRYEGTVMDGAPIFNLFQETLRGARIQSFEGILNSTSNLILSELEAGRTYESAVESARAIGFLETDPSMDLDGWDATAKACLLTNVLMDGHLRPERIPRQGISSLGSTAMTRAHANGGRLKQIARGWREDRRAKASVSIEMIGPEHPLFSVDGTSSSLIVHTDMLKGLQVIERDPGIRQTSYALYSDLLAIAEGRLTP